MNGPARRWVSVKECAAYIGLREPATRRLICLKKIPSARLGRNIFVDLPALEQLLSRQAKVKP
jgi:excisionase family DNA binding protein